MTVVDIEPVILSSIVGDHAIACDNAELDWCPEDEAKWIEFVRCPDCAVGGSNLICTPCKDLLMSTEDGVECGRCGALIFPARKSIERIEPLK